MLLSRVILHAVIDGHVLDEIKKEIDDEKVFWTEKESCGLGVSGGHASVRREDQEK